VARVAVLGNATLDSILADGGEVQRPGGTVLYASSALAALGQEVRAVGHAPPSARDLLADAGVDVADLTATSDPTRFVNDYRGDRRDQRARPGPEPVPRQAAARDAVDAVLVGPVLGEVPAELELLEAPVRVVDVQEYARSLGARFADAAAVAERADAATTRSSPGTA
jgi:hypothetical protein